MLTHFPIQTYIGSDSRFTSVNFCSENLFLNHRQSSNTVLYKRDLKKKDMSKENIKQGYTYTCIYDSE